MMVHTYSPSTYEVHSGQHSKKWEKLERSADIVQLVECWPPVQSLGFNTQHHKKKKKKDIVEYAYYSSSEK